jgi:flagellar hook-associated protein 2
MNSDLRKLMSGDIAGLSGSILRLDDLGFASNGNDDSIVASDSTKLDAAIATNLNGLKEFFGNSTSGFATAFDNYLTKTIGDSGTLVTRQTNLTAQSKAIDDSIAAMERQVLANKQRLTDSFVAMESAQSTISQQAAYLTKTFG